MGAPRGNRNAAGKRGGRKKRKGFISRDTEARREERLRKRLHQKWASKGY